MATARPMATKRSETGHGPVLLRIPFVALRADLRLAGGTAKRHGRAPLQQFILKAAVEPHAKTAKAAKAKARIEFPRRRSLHLRVKR